VLQWRLISGLSLVAILLFLIYLDLRLGTADRGGLRGLIMAPLMLGVGGLAAAEICTMFRGFPGAPHVAVGGIGTALLVIWPFVPGWWNLESATTPLGLGGWLLVGWLAVSAGILAYEVVCFRHRTQAALRIGLSFLVVGYAGLFLSTLALLRGLGTNELGMVAVLSVLAPVKLSDSVAYMAGRIWGRKRLAPVLSPGKTVEGFVGALVGGTVGAVVVLVWVLPWLTGLPRGCSLGRAILFGLAITAVGVIGDLAESLLKRDAGHKDSGTWIPGMGGVLDLIDSVLLAAPVGYVFWVSGFLPCLPD
jgi:phosphatidate cytidylyltransferase